MRIISVSLLTALLVVFSAACISEKSSGSGGIVGKPSKHAPRQGFVKSISDISATSARVEWRICEGWECDQSWWVPLPMKISNLRNRLMLKQSPKQEKFTEHQSARLLVGSPSVGRAPGAIEMKALIFEEDGQRFLEIAWNSNGGHISCEYIGLTTDASLEDLIQFEEHIDVEDDNPLVCTISGQEIYLQSRGRK